MKKLALFIAMAITMAISACHYHNINGDLDGNWHLISYETTDGSVVKPDNFYLGIAMHTINFRSPLLGRCAGNMSYDAKAKTLVIEIPYKYNLSNAGFPESPCTLSFHILHLTKQQLIMELDSNNAIYTFTKF